MEIIQDENNVDQFSLKKNLMWEKQIRAQGSIVEIPRTRGGRQIFHEMGGLHNLDPLGIPESAQYEVCVRMEDRASGYKIIFEPGDIVQLDRKRAIDLMNNGGRVRPVSADVTDLSSFLPWRYCKKDTMPMDRAAPPEQQERDRREQEMKAKEKEKAFFQVAEEVAALRTKKSFVKKW
jgi:hypothetical protein